MAESAKKAAPVKKAAASKSTPAAKRVATPKKASAARKSPAKKAPAVKKSSAAGNGAPAASAKAESASSSRFFKRATDRAKRISNDPDKLREIAEKASRSSALRSGPFAAVLEEFRALIRLVVAYARGHYRQIPFDRLVIVVAGLIYVVSPIDVIPDVVPGLGFLDDASVIAWVLKSVRDELDAFREWEAGTTD